MDCIHKMDWYNNVELLPTSRLAEDWDNYEKNEYVQYCLIKFEDSMYKIFAMPKLHKWLTEKNVNMSLERADPGLIIYHVFHFETEKDKLEFQIKWL